MVRERPVQDINKTAGEIFKKNPQIMFEELMPIFKK